MIMELELPSLRNEIKSENAEGLPVKVRQQLKYDCGVACLAMASGKPYADARAVFVSAGLSVKRMKRPYASNFKELQKALNDAGVPSRRKHFRGWDSVGQAAILKVFVRNGDWHWVYAGRDRVFGLFVHDPATDLPTFEHFPEDVMCLDIAFYEPSGCFIHIEKDECNGCLG
ncbi:hypothetical protein Rfer_4468 (plasmid) [Rhodoferax ferrireducens T118]|uniref:Peptidase C39 domain-containing protein n=1 Tax=Albidiferax ferrireducens (strain ATCC BAA-621 / DSM 15236 / T118) TaxID=338969 RepID=Q21PZ1_ALBFT|nr:hypothetical protein [Rhodoferax ferrireducens]ABD72154.1 hypothetical protein Rfer_4468 [Rhodoferax ferrireducens T118]